VRDVAPRHPYRDGYIPAESLGAPAGEQTQAREKTTRTNIRPETGPARC
jgi:hypothetical protein